MTTRPTPSSLADKGLLNTLSRVGKYVLARATMLFLAVVVAVYVTILVANLGGYVDEVVRANINFALGDSRTMKGLTPEEQEELFEKLSQAAYEAAGLNQPFVVRCFRWLGRGLTLNWGETSVDSVGWSHRAKPIRAVILDNLPRTLLIFGTANLFLFLATTFLALPLIRRHGDWVDRLVTGLSPLSSAPAWVYGIILNIVSLRLVGGMFAGGAFDTWPDEFRFAYIPFLLRHLALPFLAIFLSGLFQGLYAWRTLFLLYAREDHVEMARAKGLPPRLLERRYILRPLLPSFLTSLALLFVNLWQEVIVLEHFFNVAGIGRLFVRALGRFETPVIVALVVTFSYLLAITVFILDIAYALVDPRVRIGGERRTAKAASKKGTQGRHVWRPWKRLRRSGPVDPARKPEVETATGPPEGGVDPPRQVSRWRTWKGHVDRVRSSIGTTLRRLRRYPSAVAGLIIISALVGISVCTVIVLPYDEMIELWREGDDIWARNPKAAPPAWINVFRREKSPRTIRMSSDAGALSLADRPGAAGTVSKSTTVVSESMTEIAISFPFDFQYDALPQDLAVRIDATFGEKRPLVVLTWLTPDGREIEVASATMGESYTYHLLLDDALVRRLDGRSPVAWLFADPGAETSTPLRGGYELWVQTFVFEEGADADAEFVLYGQVHGLAGTDSKRRDLLIPLLWGMPVALTFGILAAAGTSVSSMIIAGVGTWLGGWVDTVIQRITEANMVLPFLPVSIMVFTLYSKSLWAILGVTVLLSVFGTAIKNYRALFLQVREAPYVEAARAYGAGDWRIVFRYLVPRVVPLLVPQLVVLVPGYVFLEATLAFLGVSDPVLPTWGKLIVEGLSHGLHTRDYHLLLEPLSLLFLVAFAFVLLGAALERIFQPRLREI